MRRHVKTNRTAVLAQTACLSAVGGLFFAIFFHALVHPDQRGPEVATTVADSVLTYQGLPQP